MRTFKLVIEVCVTGIKRYDYKYSPTDIDKKLMLMRQQKNQYDKNAIVVKLDGSKIGYIKKDQAKILAPILDTNRLTVRKWICDEDKSTSGYLIAQLYLVN